MKTSPDYDAMIVDFQQQWEGTDLDLMRIAQTFQAAHAVLKYSLKQEPTTDQVIAFSKVVALHLEQRGRLNTA